MLRSMVQALQDPPLCSSTKNRHHWLYFLQRLKMNTTCNKCWVIHIYL
jgi:hypothetical protein